MFFTILLKVLTSKAVEDLIAIGLNYLLAHKTAGISNDLAKTAINAVAKSKSNPTTDEVFKDAIQMLN